MKFLENFLASVQQNFLSDLFGRFNDSESHLSGLVGSTPKILSHFYGVLGHFLYLCLHFNVAKILQQVGTLETQKKKKKSNLGGGDLSCDIDGHLGATAIT